MQVYVYTAFPVLFSRLAWPREFPRAFVCATDKKARQRKTGVVSVAFVFGGDWKKKNHAAFQSEGNQQRSPVTPAAVGGVIEPASLAVMLCL